MLEWNDNDEVWFTVRAFDAPARAALPHAARRSPAAAGASCSRGYLRAISPLYTTPA